MDSYGIPSHCQAFEPTLAAARERLARLSPARYSKSRNHLDGAVSGLSPYITHGFITPHQALQALAQKHSLSFTDKLVQEFAWRAFFHHVWAYSGSKIFTDLRTPVWSGAYARHLPSDIREARTGVRAIDNAVRALYATGYLHNHARMWLASYCVHLRKVHWRAGADWMYAHLLDGDLASNHLSWQWVAGTFASKPYLFNAENVARYAPATAAAAWDSTGSVIDQSYEMLDDIARTDVRLEPELTTAFGASEPAVLSATFQSSSFDVAALDGASISLIHPWHTIGEYMLNSDNKSSEKSIYSREYSLGIIHLPFHQQFPWSERRWSFVLEKMKAQCDAIFVGDVAQLSGALARAAQVRSQATLNPEYAQCLAKLATLEPAGACFPEVKEHCTSFGKYYERVQRAAGSLEQWLALPTNTGDLFK
jgi:deoxyribodipyrimidine photo-lyase